MKFVFLISACMVSVSFSSTAKLKALLKIDSDGDKKMPAAATPVITPANRESSVPIPAPSQVQVPSPARSPVQSPPLSSPSHGSSSKWDTIIDEMNRMMAHKEDARTFDGLPTPTQIIAGVEITTPKHLVFLNEDISVCYPVSRKLDGALAPSAKRFLGYTIGGADASQELVHVKVGQFNDDTRLLNEYRILKLIEFANLDIAPKALYLSSGRSSDMVLSPRTLITTAGYGPSLHQYFIPRLPGLPNNAELRTVARLALVAIEELHELGIAHNNISEHTMKLSDDMLHDDVSIVLTEFEVARIFSAEIGTDVMKKALYDQDEALEPHRLCPLVIQGFRSSRMCDLYKWIETMAKLAFGEPFAQILREHRARERDPRVPREQKTLLNFMETVDYFTEYRHLNTSITTKMYDNFSYILTHIRSLQIDERPDYATLLKKLI